MVIEIRKLRFCYSDLQNHAWRCYQSSTCAELSTLQLRMDEQRSFDDAVSLLDEIWGMKGRMQIEDFRWERPIWPGVPSPQM